MNVPFSFRITCRSKEPLVLLALTHSGTFFQVTTKLRLGAVPIVATLM